MADLEKVASDLNSASQSLQELREKYDGALDLLDSKNTEITGALYSAKSDALQEIQTISDTATSQISQLKDTSLNAVNEAKNTAVEAVNEAKENITTELTKKAKLLTENLTWNVGSGGDYEDLQIAINEASKYIPIDEKK
ncbi:TPA: hypothetical protein ACHD26_000320 [Campylobacter jejuni]|uniref:hypothetical protein n=1 Tax=Campylobacter jejuni TaxID=197 RepID=UPI002043042D|nr:hypothetical protein [Campylobacter jejuni]